MIGDGVVVATPYGSTAYFHSITGKRFPKGIYMAFNNPTKTMKPVRIKDKVKIKIKRENAMVFADNCRKIFMLRPGDEVIIKKSREKAMFVKV